MITFVNSNKEDEMSLNKDNYCIIMAGGIGSRFWPVSKTKKPKQFIDVLGVGESLLQTTYKRFERLCPKENIYIVTNKQYRDIVFEQLAGIDRECVLLEPIRRNTAPCVVYADFKIRRKNPNAKIVVAASDHLITDEDEFISILEKAFAAVERDDVLITLGIKPTFPNTGFGYIQYVDNEQYGMDEDVKKVKLFTEKPEYNMAVQFVKSGDFLWNAGIFVWSLRSIDKAMKEFLPDVYELFSKGENIYNTDAEEAFIEETYAACPSISIDYGVMEKASNVYVIPSGFGWNDIGTWAALYSVRKKDAEGNAVVGRNVLTYDTRNCLIDMPKDKLVVLQGLEDFIIVESDNILMICRKGEEQRIKEFVTDVEIEKGTEYL